MKDPFDEQYGPAEKPQLKAMISISGLWKFLKKRKKKKKTVRRKK